MITNVLVFLLPSHVVGLSSVGACKTLGNIGSDLLGDSYFVPPPPLRSSSSLLALPCGRALPWWGRGCGLLVHGMLGCFAFDPMRCNFERSGPLAQGLGAEPLAESLRKSSALLVSTSLVAERLARAIRSVVQPWYLLNAYVKPKRKLLASLTGWTRCKLSYYNNSEMQISLRLRIRQYIRR